jgi:hypothetical protein
MFVESLFASSHEQVATSFHSLSVNERADRRSNDSKNAFDEWFPGMGGIGCRRECREHSGERQEQAKQFEPLAML